MVVGALLVDDAPESAFPLGHVIRDVRNEVREAAVGAPHDSVLVIAVLGCLQPQRAILLIGLAVGDETIDDGLHIAVRVQRGFQIIMVEAHAEGRQIRILLAPQCRHGEAPDRVEVVCGAIVGMRGTVRGRNVANVVPAIAILGEWNGRIVGLAHARLNRKRETGDLRPCIVVIEFAVNLRPLPLQQRRNRVADRGAASMTHVKGAGRICGHEFDHRATGHRGRSAAIAIGLVENPGDDCLARRRRKKQVDETGTGDFDALEPG